MIIQNSQISAKEAAKEFAATYFEEPRKVGTVCASPDAALLFQLVRGTQWYAVRLLPDYSGWEIEAEVHRS
jgi:hypothetical protein